MKFLVITKVFETIHNSSDLKRQEVLVREQIQKIMDSGKLIDGGQFADARGHFFLVDIDKEKELLELLGRGILDACNVESHPIISF